MAGLKLKGPRAPVPSVRRRIPLPPWITLLLLLLAWNVILALLQRPAPTTTIPYSTFRAQLAADNVSSVDFQGDQIIATLKNGIPWPQDQQNAPTYANVQTQMPPGGDGQLLGLLLDKKVQVTAESPPGQWLGTFFSALSGFATLLLLLWILYQARTGERMTLGWQQSRARVYTEERPKTTFADVAGVDEAKDDLREIVEYLRNPERFRRIGARIPHGVLMSGPPGTGKTLMARAVAGEAQVPFFSLAATEFVEMFVGVGASRVRDLFERAKKVQPSIIFIDEIDAIGGKRAASISFGNDEREQTLNQLLVELDGFEPSDGVVVIAATNRPDVLDPALMRAGRFDRQVTVGLPDREGRAGILRIHAAKVVMGPEVDLDLWARRTPGFSGADLANLVNEAALAAARANRDHVTNADMEEAHERVVLGAKRRLAMTDDDRRRVAAHEAGHAIVGLLHPHSDPPDRITIIPHGRALGVTEFSTDDRVNMTEAYLKARLAVALGGRTGEELACGDVSSGPENDLAQATLTARRMIERWGMSTRLPPMSLSVRDDDSPGIVTSPPYSQELAAAVDAEVEALMAEARDTARALLSGRRALFDSVVKVLFERETMSSDELRAMASDADGANGNVAERATVAVLPT